MSSLRNNLIKLAYANPNLRESLLPLIIKKYANVGEGTFSGVAEDIASERGLTRDEDKQQIQEILKEMFEKNLEQVIQQNLKKPTLFPTNSISINLDFARGSETKTIYKKILEGGDFVLSEDPMGDDAEQIDYDIPKGFTGSFYIILDLGQFDAEMLKIYKTKKLVETGDGKEEEVEAKSSISPIQAKKSYTEVLKSRKEEWESDISDSLNDRLNKQNKFLDATIAKIANLGDGEASKKIPPTIKNKMKPNVSLTGEYSVKQIERVHSDGKIECLITMGGEIAWEILLINNKAIPKEPVAQTQSEPTEQGTPIE
jgi:hypothetical protein